MSETEWRELRRMAEGKAAQQERAASGGRVLRAIREELARALWSVTRPVLIPEAAGDPSSEFVCRCDHEGICWAHNFADTVLEIALIKCEGIE